MFETADKKQSVLSDEIKKIKVEGRRTVGEISVFWHQHHINGIRLKDDKGAFVVNECWYPSTGHWETK